MFRFNSLIPTSILFADEDECASGKANCPADTVCENVLGSYHCAKSAVNPECPEGYYTVNGRCIGKCLHRKARNHSNFCSRCL